MFFLMSCERTENITSLRKMGVSDTGYYVYECTIDNHDYVKFNKGFAHSGTCRKCKQERDSIVTVIIETIKESKNSITWE